jgi:hypothetical protein
MMQMQAKRIELELPCELTDEELHSRARMISETIGEIDALQGSRTEAMRQFKERLTGLVEMQRKLARIITTGIESRMVYCVVMFHAPCEGLKRIIRTDTGEAVREEPMTDQERQLNLFAAPSDFAKFMEGQGIDPPPATEPGDPRDEDEPKN